MREKIYSIFKWKSYIFFPVEIIVFYDVELWCFKYPFVLAVKLIQIAFRREFSPARRRDGLLLGRQLSSIMRILILP